MKDSSTQEDLKERIRNLPGGGHNIEFYTPEIDVEGLVVYDWRIIQGKVTILNTINYRVQIDINEIGK